MNQPIVPSGALWMTCLALTVYSLSCVSRTPASKPVRAIAPESSLLGSIVTFAAAVSTALN
ncbi:MAG: hypothetical protein WCF10_10555, partial [Polyangiales bacterium]